MPIFISSPRAPIRDAKGSRCISMFIVEKGTPGFRVGRALKKTGWLCSDTAELVFEDCRIPAENLLGEENAGFYAVMKNFQTERIALGRDGGRACHDGAASDARTTSGNARPSARVLYDKQVIRQRLAMLQAKTEAARQFLYHCGWLVTQGRDCVREVSMLKAFTGELVERGALHLPAVSRRHGLHARDCDRAADARCARAGHRRRRDRGDARRSGETLMSVEEIA